MIEAREAPHAGSRNSPLVAGVSGRIESIASGEAPYAGSRIQQLAYGPQLSILL